MKKVRLVDIAKLANVDVSTVSRALNNKPYVMAETKERVLKAAEKLSYNPNLINKSISMGKRRLIAVIVPNLDSNIFNGICQSISKTLHLNSYETIISLTFDDSSFENRILNRIRNNLIDGIIIAGTGRNKILIKDILVSGIPVIQIVRSFSNDISSLVGDYKNTTIDGMKYLSEKGCKNIAFINGPDDIGPFNDRLSGYKNGARILKQKHIISNLDVCSDNDYFKCGYKQCEDLFNKYSDLDGFIVSTESLAMGVIRCIIENGYEVPWDIRVLSLTGNEISEKMEPPLSTMKLPVDKIGKDAANLMLNYIESEGNSLVKVKKYNSILVERESTL